MGRRQVQDELRERPGSRTAPHPHKIVRRSAAPADTPVERSLLANDLCDVLCSAVPVEVRGTLLWRTSAVWADSRDEGVHLVVDRRGLRISMLLTPGQTGDNPQLLPLFAHTRNRPALTRVVA
jgi:hypothetical protein